ncbi:MAG: CBS domain-containing protein [Lysobacterales bacterium CG17_big_fil_post_rev_8_21_14_2_50_64_11]|nr:MAG: CBS domain-containing protein [Xanthomonadales bacterium CG17_big_fil_post_rev_8_21_14_2_50_64_11]PIX60143.1 MAG: CBS domain-containing protein [Xanthomonadales bacterium CG_4_10_14_3_um_filter_64_11]
MRVADILTASPITVGLDDSLASIKRIFDSHAFHHVLVVGDGELFGVISDRDVLRAVSPFVDSPNERTIDSATMKRHAHQIMSRKPITITTDQPVELAARRMLEAKVSCLPVLDDHGQVVGIVTWHDLLRALCGLPTSAGNSA